MERDFARPDGPEERVNGSRGLEWSRVLRCADGVSRLARMGAAAVMLAACSGSVTAPPAVDRVEVASVEQVLEQVDPVTEPEDNQTLVCVASAGLQVVTEVAVDWWASRGHAIRMSDGEHCDITVQFGLTDGTHWDDEPGSIVLASYRSAVRTVSVREESWAPLTHCPGMQHIIVAHELGHALDWVGRHSDRCDSDEECLMQSNGPWQWFGAPYYEAVWMANDAVNAEER